MTAVFFLLSVTCLFVGANSVENIYPDNGWRPTSNEKVLELRRNFIKTPNVESQALRISDGHPLAEFGNRNFVKIIQTKGINTDKRELAGSQTFIPLKNHEIDLNYATELVKIVQPPRSKLLSLERGILNGEEQKNFKSEPKLRKAKMIEKPIYNNINMGDKILYIKEINDMDETTKATDKPSSINNTYEVEENPEEDVLLASDQQLFFSSKYNNPVPKAKMDVSKDNFTANLLNILANYNIRTGDKLPNYAMSLRQNSRNTDDQDFVYIPVRIPLKFNNANHLSLNPLLAVFLSNYGHYLPGLFGFRSDYKNRYGYLASNNIHNNKPFGSYKIYSDTDSYH